MALVRVYCGLVSAYPPRQLAVGSSSLYVTIVDDAGRVLDVCEIGDDSYGYAYLSSLLAERATGPYSVAIATNGGQRLVPMLLAAAGWALAVVDDEATDDIADRFVDEFHDDSASAPTQRRALGLARALQGGALSAALQPVPPELTELKPVLAALGALTTGRQAAAVALREVLRELYPAALRAYPDPADPVALAVMDALPEPGMLAASASASASGRSRDAAAAADAVAARLAGAGLADQAAITEAITALRVAIAETPRRGSISRALTATVAETVRHAVAAVRAYDGASTALVNALAERAAPSRAKHAAASAMPEAPATPASPVNADPPAAPPRSRTAIPRAARTPVTASPSPASGPPAPRHAPPLPAAPPPLEPAPAAASLPPRPAASPPPPPRPMSSPPPPAPRPVAPPPVAPPPVAPPPAPPSAPTPVSSPFPVSAPSVAPSRPVSSPALASGVPHNRPMSPPPPPPPGITPITEPRPPLPSRAQAGGQVRVPVPRPTLEGPPPGSRADWPTSLPADDRAATSSPAPGRRRREPSSNGSATSAVTPPWRADDLKPPEPPMLRLIEPTLPEELRDDLSYLSWSESESEPRPLRLVEQSHNGAPSSGIPRSAPPVSADDDNNLLIFEQTRSAWFSQDDEASWSSAMDIGWQAAEQAARPTVGDRTEAGLPRRVPHANLVPGAPPRRDDRPLRVVRDPTSIAEHTSGYFSGWRRGQEVGGYPLGGRQRPGSDGAWEFHRDEDRLSG